MIVADTNVIVYLHADNPFTDLASEGLARDPYWIAPALWRSEFRNVMTSYMRRGRINLEDAIRLTDEAEELVMVPNRRVTSGEVLRLAESSGCSAYDCEFVALAISFDTRLVTNDSEVLAAFPAVAVSLEDFAAGQ